MDDLHRKLNFIHDKYQSAAFDYAVASKTTNDRYILKQIFVGKSTDIP